MAVIDHVDHRGVADGAVELRLWRDAGRRLGGRAEVDHIGFPSQRGQVLLLQRIKPEPAARRAAIDDDVLVRHLLPMSALHLGQWSGVASSRSWSVVSLMGGDCTGRIWDFHRGLLVPRGGHSDTDNCIILTFRSGIEPLEAHTIWIMSWATSLS